MSISHMSNSLFVSAFSCLSPHLIPSPLIRLFLLSVILRRCVSPTPFLSPYFIQLSSCNPHFPCAPPERSLCTDNGCAADVISSRVHSLLLFMVNEKCKAWWDRWCRKLVHETVVKHWYYVKEYQLQLENRFFSSFCFIFEKNSGRLKCDVYIS